MGCLEGSRAYLCGAVEAAGDPNSWRDEFTNLSKNLNLRIINPMVKPGWVPPISPTWQIKAKEIVLSKDVVKRDRTILWNGIVRKWCLGMVRVCDFVIVKITGEFTVGTFEELKVAEWKPIFVICDKKIPSMWLVDQLGLYDTLDLYVHEDVQSLVKTLGDIDAERIKTDLDPFKWMFLSKFLFGQGCSEWDDRAAAEKVWKYGL